MKLRNKKTDEIEDFIEIININNRLFARIGTTKGGVYKKELHSLAELNEEWEDYEEPKEHWCVTMYGGITRIKDDEEPIDDLKEIGNYFNDKESAYDALVRLKAWKRLKDARFEFTDFGYNLDEESSSLIAADGKICFELMCYEDFGDDLELLFGGEE